MVSVYSSHAAMEATTRCSKARKIINVISRHKALGRCSILDIGTGSGHIAATLAERALAVTSVNISDERTELDGYRFVLVTDHSLPFEANSFDVVVSNHVIEHLPDQREHLAEIARVLKDDGIAYLATPNRLAIFEPHFGLAFLSWLPHQLARRYLAMRRGKVWDVYPLGSKELWRLTRHSFAVEDITVSMLQDPKRYELDIANSLHRVLERLPGWFYRLVYRFIPSYILVLRPLRPTVDDRAGVNGN